MRFREFEGGVVERVFRPDFEGGVVQTVINNIYNSSIEKKNLHQKNCLPIGKLGKG